jgi:hypothetical protein
MNGIPTMDNLDAFKQWFQTAVPGSRFMYHVGNLAADRMHIIYENVNGKRIAREIKIKHVDENASAVLDLAEDGKLFLFQVRVLPEIADPNTGQSRSRGVFAYYAMKALTKRARGVMAQQVRRLGVERLGYDNQYINI